MAAQQLSSSFFLLLLLPALAAAHAQKDPGMTLRRRHFQIPGLPPAFQTCDVNPKACHFPGSPGHDCCWKWCVNLKNNPLNCGRCGRTCGFGTSCCSGKCVNILYDRSNCGWCHNRCAKRTRCVFGMCGYA